MVSDLTKVYMTISLPSTSFTTYHNNCSVSYGSCVDGSSSNSFNITNLQQFTSSLSLIIPAYTQYFSHNTSDPITTTLYHLSSKIA